MKKKIIILFLCGIFLFPSLALAQTSYSIEDLGGSIGLGTSDLKSSVINIIQWVLGILALVCVIMIISAGFIAATASESDRTDKAKKVIIGAVIGLVIVLLAWAIVIFVAGTAANVVE